MPVSNFSDKTVFVLNHTQNFGESSGDELVLDTGLKSVSQPPTFKKSIWSNVVEAVLQYSRVVFDLFSSQKPISIITFDDEEKIHSIWFDEDQNLETLWNVFCQEGPPKASLLDLNGSSPPGLSSACNMLQMLSPVQSDLAQHENCGRVIYLSKCSQAQVESWIPEIITTLSKPTESPDHFDVTASEWVFINLTPESESEGSTSDMPIPINVRACSEIKGNHQFLYHNLKATSQCLYQGIMRLAELHYNLASTLVQDIPMKEEANTSSGSSMYGVELLHSAEVHNLLGRMGLCEKMWLKSETESDQDSKYSRPNSGLSKTLGIKWITPKANDSSHLRFAIGAYRVTLADVCNRASSCLAQFVLGGRSVALAHRVPLSFPALPRDTSQFALISTDEALLLTCHGSVMYLHVLSTICPLAHPPLLRIKPAESNPSEYRVQAFIDQILRPSRLAPASARLDYTVLPKDRARQHLERLTRYWPLGDSQTLLGKNKLADPLFEHLPKEYLEPNELSACEEAVSSIVNSIKQQVSLSDTRKSSSKRTLSVSLPVAPSVQAEAIALATELDYFLSLYSDLSAEHEQIRHHWIQSLKSVKSDLDVGTQRTPEDRFASLGLSEMVRMARLAACEKTESVDHSVPPTVTKTLRDLTVLCERLNTSFETTSQKPVNNAKKRPYPESGIQNQQLVIEPANLTTFLNLLQPTKSSRSQKGKPDFVGISTADSKGICQLYKSLKEKEKSVS